LAGALKEMDMSEYEDLIKRAKPFYDDLPIEGMKLLAEMTDAILDLEVKFNNQNDVLTDIRAANRRILQIADERAKEANRLRQALEQISRMPATPDDKMNRMSLASAVQIAMVALTDEEGNSK
jgi:hypothetical protein